MSLLSSLSELWAYVTLGATSIITEEAAPVLSGFAAHQRHLSAVTAAVACALGSWAGDIVLYEIGRRRSSFLIRRWPKLEPSIQKLLAVVRRHPWRASLLVRYAYGARFLLPVTCGVAHLPFGVYVAGSGISAWTWSILLTAVGWGFGQSAVLLLGHIRRYEDILALVLVLLVLAIVFVVQARNQARVADEIEGT